MELHFSWKSSFSPLLTLGCWCLYVIKVKISWQRPKESPISRPASTSNPFKVTFSKSNLHLCTAFCFFQKILLSLYLSVPFLKGSLGLYLWMLLWNNPTTLKLRIVFLVADQFFVLLLLKTELVKIVAVVQWEWFSSAGRDQLRVEVCEQHPTHPHSLLHSPLCPQQVQV